MQEKDPYFDLIMDEDLQKNQWPKKLDVLKTKTDHQSHMVRNMNKQLFEKYKDLKTPSGWTISRAINTGVLYPSSTTGCHAGDLQSYQIFQDFFNPVIEGYHKGYKTDGSMKHTTDLKTPLRIKLDQKTKKKVISTRIRCARNLKAFPLNPSGTLQTRLQIADLMEKVFAKLQGDLKGKFYRHTDMTPQQQKQFVDQHFLFRGKDKMQAASGYHQHWPKGRGIFISEDKKFLVWINEGDHIRIISMEQGDSVQTVFQRFARAVNSIQAILKEVTGKDDVFMHNEKLGMITCCPTNLGTGLRGSVHILLPRLIKRYGFELIDKIALGLNCQARGSTGQHSEVIDRIDISNIRRLGLSQFRLVEDMIRCANYLAYMQDGLQKLQSEEESISKESGCKVI